MIIAFAECSLGWEVRKLVSRTLPGRWRGRSWCYGDFSTTIFRATTNSTAFIDFPGSVANSSLLKCERFGTDSQILTELGLYGFTWTLQVLKPEPESHRGSTSESEAESNPKRNSRPPQGENLRRIP
jgi:hypothetical protein